MNRDSSKLTSLVLAFFCLATAGAESDPPKADFKVRGTVPPGWEVVEESDAPVLERVLTLENGEEKRVTVSRYILRPTTQTVPEFLLRDSAPKVTRDQIQALLQHQNESLSQFQQNIEEFSQRLRDSLAAVRSNQP